MDTVDRRSLFRGTAATALAVTSLPAIALPTPAVAQVFAPAPGAGAARPPEVTRILGRYVAEAKATDIPDAVRKEATRTLLNWVGSAVGGSQQDAPRMAVAAVGPFSGPAQASLFGRRERLDIMHAALVNGISSHVLDYDDTHLRTIIHPAGPVASAIVAMAEQRPVSGLDLMTALVIGIEVECRMGNSVTPEHYAIGWHTTGSTGVFGAAAAAGRLLGLTAQQMTWALGIAASQPVGLKVQFGSMTKSFHPGQAAQNGLLSALLAQRGFTASEVAIEGFDGWGQALSTRRDWSEVTNGLGDHYEVALNTYKPFACGIVMHPALDAAIQLHNQGIKPEQVQSITLRVHPLVLNLTSKTDPQTGLESKFSIYHAVAVALVTGQAGEHAFTDAMVRDPVVLDIRKRVTATVDTAIKADQVNMVVTLQDGSTVQKFIEHAVGSQTNPMTDAQLQEKFAGNANEILPANQQQRLMDLCWNAWSLPDAGAIGRAGAAGSTG